MYRRLRTKNFSGKFQDVGSGREAEQDDRAVRGDEDHLASLGEVLFEGQGGGELGVELLFGRVGLLRWHVCKKRN